MVICTVCRNTNKYNKTVSYFNYPRDPFRLQAWLKATGREDLLPKLQDHKTRQQFRICEDHFEKEYIKYSKKGNVKYLYSHAIPTLNLHSYDAACSSQLGYDVVARVSQENQNYDSVFIKEENDNFPENDTSDVKDFPEMPDEDSTSTDLDDDDDLTPSNPTKDVENRAFQTKKPICESKSTQTSLQLLGNTPIKRRQALELQEIKKRRYDIDSATQEDFFNLCDKFLSKGMSQMIKWQLDLKKGNQNQECQGLKFFALNIHYSGPLAYKFLSNTLSLPSSITLKKLVKPIGTELDHRLLCALKTKFDKMILGDKLCSVSVECRPLRLNLFYDVRNDRVVGFHEVNGVQKIEPAKFVIVMMARGILQDWKQPVALAFLSQFNCNEVNKWIDDVIKSLLNIGLHIRVLITENSNDFLNASKLRLHEDKTYFCINGHKIYYMFDVPHLMKCVMKDFKTFNFIYGDKIAKWAHVREFYNVDKRRESVGNILSVRAAPKLTDRHIDADVENMSVKEIAQVLSGTVSSGIKANVGAGYIDVAAYDTAEFIAKINKLFDIFNYVRPKLPNKNKKAISGIEIQIHFLEEMLSLFKNLKFRTMGTVVTSHTNFAYGFQVSIKSLLQLNEQIKYISTRRLTKEYIEKFFEKVTKNSSHKPTSRQISVAFNKLFIKSILQIPENTKNDQDFESQLMRPEEYPVFNTQDCSSDTIIKELTVGTKDYQISLPEKNVVLYVSSYLYGKCLAYHKCPVSITLSCVAKNMESAEFLKGLPSLQGTLVQTGFLTPTFENFVKFIELLEKKFCHYFDFKLKKHVNIGNDILKHMAYCTFDMPCECFPLDYLKKLFIRFRLYQSLKNYKESKVKSVFNFILIQ